MIIALLQWRYDANTRRFPAGSFPETRFEVLGANMTSVQVMVVALALVVGLTWLVASSWLGRAMRAIAENPSAARVLGINGVR